jgi:glycine dehydrogenase subunit 1
LAYISNTDADHAEMLAAIGVDSFAALLSPIPEALRLKADLNVLPSLDEPALLRHLSELAAQNANLDSHLSFLGAGAYDHFKPAVVAALAGRGEFSTAYTPYQPEMSQGMLQAIYEYQTLICALTGMDLSNASMYDASTGLAEAALMATALTERPEVVVLGSVHPNYRQVVETYTASTGFRLVETPWNDVEQGYRALRDVVGSNTACVLFQQPGFLGHLEDPEAIVRLAHEAGAYAVVSVDPIALGLLKAPADYDADIVVGEGQALGNPIGFGGPLLGFFACKKQFIRHFPGRIVGATVDQQGRRGYTMTLRTREQDIRREKATSNICTNQALLALYATIYLCELGKSGLRHVADLCLQKAHYARQQLCQLPGVHAIDASQPFFKEFAIRLPAAPKAVNAILLRDKIIGGLPLTSYYHDLDDAMLVCVTETRTRADIDRFVAALATALEELREL